MPRSSRWLILSGALLALYLGYIVAAKIAQVARMAMPLRLSETAEFLLFAASCAAFVMAVIAAERSARAGRFESALAEIDENLERYLMLACYVFCCAVIIHDVGRRFLINYSAAWSQETAQYAFIYLGWIGGAFAVKERAHIRFDILLNAVPERARGLIYVLGEIATILFAIIALRYSFHTIHQLWRFEGATPVLRVSKIWAEAAIPIGFTLIVVRALQRLAGDIADLRAGRPAYQGKALFEE